ncbi:MAG TPA: RNA methyltransferase [Caulobacteraceae bacterium]|nr:RNA methyltransferase [Caulobacteraceae bacterium]
MDASPCVILDRPQLAENIGAVARVMANFGLADLRLVAPRDGWPQERAWTSASGANWPLDAARLYPSIAAAIADLQLVHATTARPREARTPVITPRQSAAALRAAAAEGRSTGLLFGGERAGLETADIASCQAIVTVPIDPRFRSLNLAQAVAVTAYEWWTAANATPAPAFADHAHPATADELAGLFEHLERELDAAGFFFPPEKTPAMVRNLRALFARAGLSAQETATLRGAIAALSKGRGRVLARLARERAQKEQSP